jgi:hypothetical protein
LAPFGQDEIENNLDICLKLFILLYADDTALLAETANDLQTQLDAFYMVKLHVVGNNSKTVNNIRNLTG